MKISQSGRIIASAVILRNVLRRRIPDSLFSRFGEFTNGMEIFRIEARGYHGPAVNFSAYYSPKKRRGLLISLQEKDPLGRIHEFLEDSSVGDEN